jgi:hypothetical protein
MIWDLRKIRTKIAAATLRDDYKTDNNPLEKDFVPDGLLIVRHCVLCRTTTKAIDFDVLLFVTETFRQDLPIGSPAA